MTPQTSGRRGPRGRGSRLIRAALRGARAAVGAPAGRHEGRGADIDVGCITYQRFNQKRDGYRPPLACRRSARGLELEREQDILRVRREFAFDTPIPAPRATWTSFNSRLKAWT